MNTKPKIAVIGLKGLPAFGGAAAVGENLIDQLKDEYDFTVYSTSSHTDLKTGNHNGYKQIVFKKILSGKLNSLYYYIASMTHCMFCNYDLIHTHHNISGMIIPLLKIKYRVVNTLHSTKVTEKFRKYSIIIQLLERITITLSDAVTCVAYSTYLKYYNKYNVKFYYIPNGTYINKNFVSFKKKSYESYIVFAAGRIIPSKGCHLLLEAMQCAEIYKKLIIIGNALSYTKDYYNELYKMSENLNVEFCGLIKDKNKLYEYINKSDYFIFPSLIESMSMMLLEVATLKVPIICSDIYENKFIFDENEVLYFSSGDYSDLARKLAYAEDNKNDLMQRAELAYQKVSTQYNWCNISREYAKIYSGLLKNDKKY